MEWVLFTESKNYFAVWKNYTSNFGGTISSIQSIVEKDPTQPIPIKSIFVVSKFAWTLMPSKVTYFSRFMCIINQRWHKRCFQKLLIASWFTVYLSIHRLPTKSYRLPPYLVSNNLVTWKISCIGNLWDHTSLPEGGKPSEYTHFTPQYDAIFSDFYVSWNRNERRGQNNAIMNKIKIPTLKNHAVNRLFFLLCRVSVIKLIYSSAAFKTISVWGVNLPPLSNIL